MKDVTRAIQRIARNVLPKLADDEIQRLAELQGETDLAMGIAIERLLNILQKSDRDRIIISAASTLAQIASVLNRRRALLGVRSEWEIELGEYALGSGEAAKALPYDKGFLPDSQQAV